VFVQHQFLLLVQQQFLFVRKKFLLVEVYSGWAYNFDDLPLFVQLLPGLVSEFGVLECELILILALDHLPLTRLEVYEGKLLTPTRCFTLVNS